MNKPSVSKINYAALCMQIIAIAAILDWIPRDMEQPLMEITMLVVPTIIQVLRTWFTGKKET